MIDTINEFMAVVFNGEKRIAEVPCKYIQSSQNSTDIIGWMNGSDGNNLLASFNKSNDVILQLRVLPKPEYYKRLVTEEIVEKATQYCEIAGIDNQTRENIIEFTLKYTTNEL